MNNIFKIFGLVGSFYAMTLNCLLAQTNNTDNLASKFEQPIMNQLLEFETNKSLDHIKVAIAVDHLNTAIENLNNDQSILNRKQQTILWFKILATIDKHLDPNFNETNANFSLNVIPPPDGGVQYSSGVDPSVIKDPIARAKYQAMLKTNRENAESYGFQSSLQRINKQANFGVEIFLKSFYTSSESDKRELNEILDQSKLSSLRKQTIKNISLP